MGSEDRRAGALLVAAVCLPFAAGAHAGPDGDTGLRPPGPFHHGFDLRRAHVVDLADHLAGRRVLHRDAARLLRWRSVRANGAVGLL
jgi:hypothetical protein